MKNITAEDLNKLLTAELSKSAGWDIERRAYIIHSEAVIDIAIALLKRMKRGAK